MITNKILTATLISLLFFSIALVSADIVVTDGSCGPEDPGDCPSGYDRICWETNDFVNYFTCERDGSPQCPSAAPNYCSSTQLCYVSPSRCDCLGVSCPNICSNSVLSTAGTCEIGGSCGYHTTSVSCCVDTDCSTGLVCSGNSCSPPNTNGQNLGFENWIGDVSPIHWDIAADGYGIARSVVSTEGSYSLGFVSTGFSGFVDACKFVEASQDIDLTGIDEVRFTCSAHCTDIDSLWGGGTPLAGQLAVRWENRVSLNGVETTMSIGENILDTSSVSGVTNLKFVKRFCPVVPASWGGLGNTPTSIDDVRLISDNSDLQDALDRIGELTGDINAIIGVISNLETTLAEKIFIVQTLTTNINDQALLIDALTQNIDEQAQIILNLSVKANEQAILIVALTQNVDEQIALIGALDLQIGQQADLINALTTNLEEKALLVSQLQSTNVDQAALITEMKLSFSDQAQIINNLDNVVKDDAELINNLDLSIQEQANLITSLNLNLEEKANLISELKLTNEETVILIDNLKLKVSEQKSLLTLIQDNKSTSGVSTFQVALIVISFILLILIILFIRKNK